MAAKICTITFRNVRITMHPTPIYMAFALVFLIATQFVADGLNFRACKNEDCCTHRYCNSLGGYPAQDPHSELCSGVSPCCVVTIPSSYRLWIAVKVTEALRLPMFTIAHALLAYFAFMDEHTSFKLYALKFLVSYLSYIVVTMAFQWWSGWQLAQGAWPRVWVNTLLSLVGGHLIVTSRVTFGRTVLQNISSDDEEGNPHDEAPGRDLLEQARVLRKHCEMMVNDARDIKELAEYAMDYADSAIAKAHILVEHEKSNQELKRSEEAKQEESMGVASVQPEGVNRLDEGNGTSRSNHAYHPNATCPTPVEMLGAGNGKSCSEHIVATDATITTPVSAANSQGEVAQESSEFNKEEFCQKLTSSLTAFIQARDDISEDPTVKEEGHDSEDTRRENSSDFVMVEMSEVATERE